MKKCSSCGEWKDESEFGKRKASKDGLKFRCKECNSKYNKEYRKNNKEKISNKKQEWYENNRVKNNKKSKEYRKNNKDSVREYGKKHRENNKEKINIHTNKRYRIDLEFKLVSNIRCRVYSALKNNSKSASTIELLGCSPEEARVHLEGQFQEGMSWENHGNNGWHIDHIRPCASFDLSDPEQQKECFHYTNLQPLWAKDNLSKGSKIL